MSRRLLAAALLVAGLTSAACDGEAPSADGVRAQIERQAPGLRLRRDSHLRLGRLKLALARGIVRLAEPGDRETSRVLSRVRRLEVATWEVGGALPERLVMPSRLEDGLARAGWSPMVKTREEDATTWIYYREDAAGAIRNLYIVELDAAELTIIDLAGTLDRLVAELVADDPDAFLAGLGA